MKGWKMSAAVAAATVAAAAWAAGTDRPDCQLPVTTTAWTPIPPSGAPAVPPTNPAPHGVAPVVGPLPVVAAPPPAAPEVRGWDDCPACGMG